VPVIAAQLRGGGGRLVSLFYGAGLVEQEVATIAPQIAADANPDLLALYLYAELARDPDELFRSLVRLNAQTPRSRDGFYAVRAHLPAGRCERAARFLWLSAMSFNGLWRVNRAGDHNVPPDRARLARAWPLPTHGQLAAAAERIRCVVFFPDWRSAVALVRPGDVVISDPPYLGGFDGYTALRFSRAHHEALAATLEQIAKNGCFVLAFNSPAATPLYSRWAHLELGSRSGGINCDGHARQAVDELLAFGAPSKWLADVA
jgi:DNA adenine methylase